ncbi:MAG: DUF935 family protein [Planctomycetota bacterium]
MPANHVHIPDPSNAGKLWLPPELQGGDQQRQPVGGYIDDPSIDPATRYDQQRDPAAGVAGAPFNWGEFLLPHASTFTGVISTYSKVYRPSDEALRHSAQNARYMRNDPIVMEPLELRQKSVALLDWHIEPEDEDDEQQKQAAAQLEAIIKSIPRFLQYRETLLHATWFGRYAVENRYQWKRIKGKMRSTIVQWLPLHGDKLVFRYDDGSGDRRAGQIGIRVGANAVSVADKRRFFGPASDKIETTDFGLAYFLDSWERPGLSVHKYMVEDGEWEDPFNAGRIHGVGIRSRVYWAWYQKQETLAMLMEYLERSAAGVEIWYYPMGNPKAEADAKKAAQERMTLGRNVITVPRPVGPDAAYFDVQRIEPGMAGVAELKEVIENYFGHQIKRYILGQTLTTEASATGLGSNLADVQLETFMQHVRYDSLLLGETLTEEVVEPIKRFNFPEEANCRYRCVIDTESPDAEAKMEAMQRLFQMGMPIRGQDLRELVGATKPVEGDEVASMAALQKQMADVNPQPGEEGEVAGLGAEGAIPESPEPVDPEANIGALTADASAVSPQSSGYAAGPETGDRRKIEASRGKKAA